MSLWFPPKRLVDMSPMVRLRASERIEEFPGLYPGDHLRTQLGVGAYSNRLLQLDFGDVRCAIEQVSQKSEWQTFSSTEFFVISVVLEQNDPFVTYGVERDTGSVMITPPGSDVHTILPANGMIGLFQIKSHALLSNPALPSEVVDWFARLERRGTFVHSPWLADRLRNDMRHFIKCALNPMVAEQQTALCANVSGLLISDLAMEFLRRRYSNTIRRSPTFEMFWEIRSAMLELDERPTDVSELAGSDVSISRRTLETIFAKTAGLPPSKYWQVHKLNRTRRKLRDPNYSDDSIGDIAAAEGFWDWSRFTSYYRRQFGERPSETRSKSSFAKRM